MLPSRAFSSICELPLMIGWRFELVAPGPVELMLCPLQLKRDEPVFSATPNGQDVQYCSLFQILSILIKEHSNQRTRKCFFRSREWHCSMLVREVRAGATGVLAPLMAVYTVRP